MPARAIKNQLRGRFLIAIPAHDEGATIAETVRSCRAVRYPASLFDVRVIADNCTDDTADRARLAGATVLERSDATKKSKGHAIEYLIGTLKQSGEFDALDALVIIDADSTVQPDLLEQFALGLDRGSDWMQCYDCVGNADRSSRTRIMAYAFSLFNGITLAGRQARGLSAGLRGNGMCISTRGIAPRPLAGPRLGRRSRILLVRPHRRRTRRLYQGYRGLRHHAFPRRRLRWRTSAGDGNSAGSPFAARCSSPCFVLPTFPWARKLPPCSS